MKRYMLDLSNLFSDHRQKVCIAHRDKWSTIRSLIHTLRQLFAIESELVVLSGDGVYYPETENIAILRDNETLKVVLLNTNESRTRSPGTKRHVAAIDTTADHSQIEEIESILSSLPTPKRRRVRKRKAKQAGIDEDQARPSKAALPKEKPPQAYENLANGSQERIVPVDDKVLKHTLKVKQKQNESELPYRNLNRVMKARVVRALSPAALSPLHNGNHRTDEDRTSAVDTNNDEILPKEVSSTQACPSSIKPRVVRAISDENTIEVKQEQIEKCSNDTSSGGAVYNTVSEANNSSTTPTLLNESVGSAADETSADNGEITIVSSEISL
ncbi:uncharacterized protein LOC131211842 [Anopheles bellator]|uniref:uncharacterized protein LOC131211842 n=1 Tax=Anopheles bellator TaxID=139047 RepID=UPI00264887CC|nr:uncharacterized protein LOC131211842 [Anopheles bellator]